MRLAFGLLKTVLIYKIKVGKFILEA